MWIGEKTILLGVGQACGLRTRTRSPYGLWPVGSQTLTAPYSPQAVRLL